MERIVTGILLLFFIVGTGTLLVGINTMTGDSWRTSEATMNKHVQTLYPEYTNIQVACQHADTDNDGYVRCSATALDKRGNRTPIIEAECTGGATFNLWSWALNEGCGPIKFQPNH